MEAYPLVGTLVHNTLHLSLVAVVAGVLAHNLYFRRGYHDTEGLRFIIIHSAVYVGLTVLCISESSVTHGILTSSIAFSSYLVGLFGSIVIYRLFFHRLRHFPGPIAAKITRFYGLYLARNGQLHIEQNKLFERYGDIVRIGMALFLLVVQNARLHMVSPE